ncbi:NHS-like protein 3 isoform X1 [Labrus bergylta]|uniref:NHS-like protein 3 isoform X1 n=1 Tax=Labrus bergylta TaxID=56723 RepID=UPI0033133DFE
MSNRDSMGIGELIPQDVVDIFAQKKHTNRSRKKRSNSLGRALGWLKGKKKKDFGLKGQSLGLGPALDLALDGRPAGHKGGQKSGKHVHPQAVQKRDHDSRTPSTPLFQENVFIEASRPEYLENLHSEALEGLKMMQEEETNNGVEYRDNESTISHTDGEGGGFMTDSTIGDTTSVVSVKSSVSTRSSRSGLTRQESTFRPLNSGKKSKTRRRHRKTVAGIPQHVQRELGLDRVGWTMTQKAHEENLYDGETDESSTTDGLQQATQSQTGTSAAIHPLNKKQLEQLAATNAGHRDDLALLNRLDPDLSAEQRHHSLAVHWMTTANNLQQEPPSPVMSMSPQAMYMSKIIPNAVLPPSIDVVEISRGRSRNSVRTVSKSSLVMSSPAPSRASSRASSTRTTSSKASTITSASRQNLPNMSDSSGWSNSESSETLVSDSSTISSSSTPRQNRSQDGNVSAKEDNISVHSSISKASKSTSNGKLVSKRVVENKEGPFVRSLSVMKPKRAPLPPNRSYSLHNKMKRRSRDVAEVRVIPGEENEKNKSGSSPIPSKIIDSPGYTADTSSLEDSTGSVSFSPIRTQLNMLKAGEAAKVGQTDSKDASQEKNKQSTVVSPSSGYSSQEGTSAVSSKQSHSSSPRHKRGLLAKLQRFFPGPTTSPSTPPPTENIKPGENLKPDTSVDTASPSVRALRELFNIPPHPKVHAPPPPPPEVWVHSRRSIELLLGPPLPDNIYAIIKKNPKDRRQHRQSPSASTESSVKLERKHKTATAEAVNGSTHVMEVKKVQESRILNAEVHKENNDRLVEQNVDLKVTKRDEKVSGSDILSGMLVKAVVKREERLAAAREEAAKKSCTNVTSPESSWPPPPPPIGQVVITDEMDFSLPPPPMFGGGLIFPVQVPPESSNPGVDSCSTPTPLNIPPPPSYTAPAPPVEAVTPATLRRLTPLPPIEEVPFTPPPEEVSPPELPIEASPPLPTPLNEVRPPPALIDVSPPQPPIAFSLLPPPTKEVIPSPPPPTEFIPPPPPKDVFPLPPPIEVIQLQPPKETSPVPPPKEFIPPPPPIEVIQTPPPEEASPPAPPQPLKDISTTLVTVVSPPPVQEPPPPPVIEVAPLPPKEISTLSTEEVSLPSSEEATPVSTLAPPQSIPPPPPLPSQPQQETDPSRENIPSEPDSTTVTSISILAPPQSIPPPPLIQPQPDKVHLNTDSPAPQETPPPPTPQASPPAPEKAQEPAPPAPANIPLPPPLPSAEPQVIPASKEKQTPEQTSTPVMPVEPTPIVTPSLLQMVKLRSVNSSPEPPKAPEQPQAEVTMRNQVQTSSSSGEAPQKPIRRSLIILSPTSPTSTSPPAVVTSQPAVPIPQSLLVPPTSSSTVTSPTKKSPPAMTASPSMNLQEAIRLRTAARSKENAPSRLSLHSPTSPRDLHKSPSSTASFIFSKSNKRVVIETKPVEEKKSLDVPSVTKVETDAESEKKGGKVPPPVAKKPKTKGKETETCEGVEQTAGQDAHQELIKGAADEANETAGTVEGGTMTST